MFSNLLGKEISVTKSNRDEYEDILFSNSFQVVQKQYDAHNFFEEILYVNGKPNNILVVTSEGSEYYTVN